MAVVSSEQAEQAVLDEYTKKYGTHQELFRKYSEVIPGGCSRSIGVWKPFPVFVSKGQVFIQLLRHITQGFRVVGL